MPEIEVIKIMGEPDKKLPAYLNKEQTIFYYEPPFASSDGIEIYIDTNKRVDRITLFE